MNTHINLVLKICFEEEEHSWDFEALNNTIFPFPLSKMICSFFEEELYIYMKWGLIGLLLQKFLFSQRRFTSIDWEIWKVCRRCRVRQIAAITRLARRSGVKHTFCSIYEETRRVPKVLLENVIRDVVTYHDINQSYKDCDGYGRVYALESRRLTLCIFES